MSQDVQDILRSLEDYEEIVPDPARLDDVFTFYMMLSRPVWDYRVHAELNYTQSWNDSNQDFSSYERNVVGVAVSASL